MGRGIDEIFDVDAQELIEPGYRAETSLRPVRDVMFGRHFFLSLDQDASTLRARASECREQPVPD